MVAVLVTRFILNLRSVDLPQSNVPGEDTNQTSDQRHSTWLAHLPVGLASINVMGNIGAPLDHGEPDDDGRTEDDNISMDSALIV